MENFDNSMHESLKDSLPPIHDLLSSLQKDPLTSTRFFFSPTNTKSLMEDVSSRDMGDLLRNTKPCFLNTSMKMAMASKDPYSDFKRSMEEMVDAYNIRELPRLQELLLCYLSLNQRKNHKVIMMAFMDLLLDLVAQ